MQILTLYMTFLLLLHAISLLFAQYNVHTDHRNLILQITDTDLYTLGVLVMSFKFCNEKTSYIEPNFANYHE